MRVRSNRQKGLRDFARPLRMGLLEYRPPGVHRLTIRAFATLCKLVVSGRLDIPENTSSPKSEELAFTPTDVRAESRGIPHYKLRTGTCDLLIDAHCAPSSAESGPSLAGAAPDSGESAASRARFGQAGRL